MAFVCVCAFASLCVIMLMMFLHNIYIYIHVYIQNSLNFNKLKNSDYFFGGREEPIFLKKICQTTQI